jgi:hypothetical protein
VLHQAGAEYFATNSNSAVVIYGSGLLSRYAPSSQNGNAQLWIGSVWGANPNLGSAFGNIYRTNMPADVLTSQGLA